MADSLMDLAKSTQGGVAATLLFSCAAIGGGQTKEFMPPFDYWASLACTVAMYVGIGFLVLSAFKSQFRRSVQSQAD